MGNNGSHSAAKANRANRRRYALRWQEKYTQLVQYKDEHGDCNVPYGWTQDKALGKWVSTQRSTRKCEELLTERITLLDNIGFVWEPNHPPAKWQESYTKLVRYKGKHGNCNVPQGWKQDKSLGNWVMTQRAAKVNGRLTPEREALLADIGFVWVLIAQSAPLTWEERYEALLRYKGKHGDCNVPRRWEQDKLGNWVGNQRQAKANGKLTAQREALFDKIGFEWDPLETEWQENYTKLVRYKDEHHHCNVPYGWKQDTSLARWVATQRQAEVRGELTPERQALLDDIGFVWDRFGTEWQESYTQLVRYQGEHGNCNVPSRWEQDKSLGDWVTTQRTAKVKGELAPQRVTLLDKIGFVWDGRETLAALAEAKWQESYTKLVRYKEEHGNCNVPTRWEQDKPLGIWVSHQRKTKRIGTLSQGHQALLDNIGFVWRLRTRTGSSPTISVATHEFVHKRDLQLKFPAHLDEDQVVEEVSSDIKPQEEKLRQCKKSIKQLWAAIGGERRSIEQLRLMVDHVDAQLGHLDEVDATFDRLRSAWSEQASRIEELEATCVSRTAATNKRSLDATDSGIARISALESALDANIAATSAFDAHILARIEALEEDINRLAVQSDGKKGLGRWFSTRSKK